MNRLRNFMIGRYGTDQLTFAILIISILISMLTSITGVEGMIIISYTLSGVCLFRILSRNVVKRQRENIIFIKWWNPIMGKIRQGLYQMKSMKTHRFYKCPNCNLKVRVPKGKGKILITCPKCRKEFTKKT